MLTDSAVLNCRLFQAHLCWLKTTFVVSTVRLQSLWHCPYVTQRIVNVSGATILLPCLFCVQDPRANWICNPVHKHRELRGLTSAGKTYRGLRGKGHNYHKARPSVRATYRRNQNPSLRRYR